jgi:mitogen-activated protein kinase 1/3
MHTIFPPSKRDFGDIYVFFELMNAYLQKVIKVNNELTKEHHLFYLSNAMRTEIYSCGYVSFFQTVFVSIS